MTAPKKRGRGRPKLHKDTRMVAFRASMKAGDTILGIISFIRTLTQEVDVPAPLIVLDALKARLKQLHNRNPAQVERKLKLIDEAIDSYEHVKR
jgi:hypothetical protein